MTGEETQLKKFLHELAHDWMFYFRNSNMYRAGGGADCEREGGR